MNSTPQLEMLMKLGFEKIAMSVRQIPCRPDPWRWDFISLRRADELWPTLCFIREESLIFFVRTKEQPDTRSLQSNFLSKITKFCNATANTTISWTTMCCTTSTKYGFPMPTNISNKFKIQHDHKGEPYEKLSRWNLYRSRIQTG